MSEELKPCPACNEPSPEISNSGLAYYVVCPHCCMRGSEAGGPTWAAEAWNAMPRRLRWSKETPTMPGWYWWKEGRNEESMIVHVFIVEHISGEKFLCAQFAGEGDIVHRIDKIDGEWAGPISEPEE